MRVLMVCLWLVVAGAAWAGGGPLVMLAGGGTEGEIGDRASWSARLYRHLLDRGDVTGDGRVVVAVLSAEDESDFIPRYFRWLGADEAVNVKVDSRDRAAAADTLAALDRADAVFIKGGDQGRYYRLWNDTPLEGALRRLVERHGAIGGTSAGAMSLAEVALAGGKSPTSAEVLADACTPELDDVEGGSALHADFLGFVSACTIDTHFTERARLGRLLGVLARAAEENRRRDLLGIGVSEQTGVVIEGGVARVIGRESVWFVHAQAGAKLWRKAGRPLVFAPLDADVLVEGWSYRLAERSAGRPPEGALPAGSCDVPPGAGALALSGADPAAEESFNLVLRRGAPFQVRSGHAVPRLRNAIGVADAEDEQRGFAQEGIVCGLYEYPGAVAFLLPAGSRVSRTAEQPARLVFGGGRGPEAAAIVIDSHRSGWRGLAPEASSMDPGDGSLRAAALTRLTVGAYAATADSGVAFDMRAHAPTR